MKNTTNNAQNTPQKRKQNEPSTSAAATSMRTAGKLNPSLMPQEINPVVTGEPLLTGESSVTSTNPDQPRVSNNSSVHGTAYHLRLGMVIMLRLFKMFQQDNQHRFELAFEDPVGGKFDDITVRYSSPRQTSRTVRIQVKHKDTTDDVQQTSGARDTVSEEDLLPEKKKDQKKKHKNTTDDVQKPTSARYKASDKDPLPVKEKDQKKGPFSLRMYFESAREVMKSSPNEKQTFILCTNKSLHTSVTFFEKVDIKLKIDRDFLDDLNAICYQLNYKKRWKKLDDVLKPASEADIKAFYDNFVLVCNTHNADQLTLKALALLHDLVNNQFTSIYNALHTLVFAAMDKGVTHKFTPDTVKGVLKKHTGTPDTNKYSNMTMSAQMLRESKLYDFLGNKDLAYTFPGYYSKEFSIHLIAQTVSIYTEDVNKTYLRHLNPTYEMIFIDCASFKDCEDVTDRLHDDLSANFNGNMHNVYRLGHILNVIFTHNKTIHHSKLSSFEAEENEKKQQKYRFKILLIETIDDGEFSDGRNPLRKDQSESTWRVANLAEEVRKQAYQRNTSLSLFGTTVSLETLITNDDPLRYFIDLDAMNVEGCDISHKQNYEKVESWYVGRRFKRFVERNRSSERETDNNGDDECNLPGLEDDDGGSKVNIILNDAGHGKSSLFTKLAYRLSTECDASHVIRLNARDFSTDFKQMKSPDIKKLDTAKVLKMLYHLIYLVLFWHNGKKDTKIEKRREEAKACAELLTYSDGSISGDKVEVKQLKQLTTSQLAALRVFKEKYNAKQLIVLLDGFDEIAPTYKEVVLTCFKRFAQLEGVRKMYISSRPYHFTKELEAIFPGCRMFELDEFSEKERCRTVRTYVRRKMEGGDSDTEKTIAYELSVALDGYRLYLTSVPLLLFMTLQICFPIVKHNVTTGKNSESNPLPALDILQIFEAVVERKVQRRVLDKQNKPLAALDNVDENYQFSKTLRDTEDHHALLAMLVMLDEEYQEKLLEKDERKIAKNYMEEIKLAVDKTGIITGVQDNTPQFIIRTFTEYFAALWLYNNWERMVEKDFFQCGLFWSEEWSQIRDFFDRMALRDSAECDLHLAIINRSFVQVEDAQSDSSVTATDKFGRLPLHLAASLDCLHEDFDVDSLITEKTINAIDNLCQWSASNYAIAITYNVDHDFSNMLQMLLDKGASFDVETFVKQIRLQDLEKMLFNAERFIQWFDSEEKQESADQLRKKFKELLFEVIELKINSQYPNTRHQMLLENRNDGEPPLAPLLVRSNETSEIESVLYFTVNHNLIDLFRILFQHLCKRCNIPAVEDSQIDVNIVLEDVPESSWNKYEDCSYCIFSYFHPTYPEREGFILQSLAYAISNVNIGLIAYILKKTNKIITQENVMWIFEMCHVIYYHESEQTRHVSRRHCFNHDKALFAFSYLLDQVDTTELSRDLSEDEEGRNLLHWIAERGCFLIFHRLLEKGLDPTTINAKNGWNVFHHVTIQKNLIVRPRCARKPLEYLLVGIGWNMVGLFDSMLNTLILEDNLTFADIYGFEVLYSYRFSKQQLALMGIVAVFGKTALLTDEEREEAKTLGRTIKHDTYDIFFTKYYCDTYRFTYEIFGEYLAAWWLYTNNNRLKNDSYSRRMLYWKKDFARMYTLFDLIVLINGQGNACKLHLAIIHKSEEQAIKLLSDEPPLAADRDALGRLPLHLAVRNELLQLVEKLLNMMSLESINMRDELLGWNALDYAFNRHSELVVEMLLTRGADVHVEVLVKTICSYKLQDLFVETKIYGLLLKSCERTEACAEELYIRVVEHLLRVEKIDIDAPHGGLDDRNETVQQYCQRMEYNEILEQFKSQAAVQPQL